MTPKQTLKILKETSPGTYLTCRMSMAYSRERGHMEDWMIFKVIKANKNGLFTVGYVHRFKDLMKGVSETFVFDTQRSVTRDNGLPYDQISVMDLNKKIVSILVSSPEDSGIYDRMAEDYLNSKIASVRKQLFFYKKGLNRVLK